MALKNKFHVLKAADTQMIIRNCNYRMTEVTMENTGFRKSVRYSDRLRKWNTTKQRKHRLFNIKSHHIKKKMAKEYSQKDKDIKCNSREDKSKFIEIQTKHKT